MNNIDKEVPVKIIWQWLIPNSKNKILRPFIHFIYFCLWFGSNCVIEYNSIMYIPYSVSKNNLFYSLLVDFRINMFCNLVTCDCVFQFFYCSFLLWSSIDHLVSTHTTVVIFNYGQFWLPQASPGDIWQCLETFETFFAWGQVATGTGATGLQWAEASDDVKHPME